MIQLDDETAREVLALLEEANYWVTEATRADWHIFSRVYGTRSDFFRASKRTEKALGMALKAAGVQS